MALPALAAAVSRRGRECGVGERRDTGGELSGQQLGRDNRRQNRARDIADATRLGMIGVGRKKVVVNGSVVIGGLDRRLGLHVDDGRIDANVPLSCSGVAFLAAAIPAFVVRAGALRMKLAARVGRSRVPTTSSPKALTPLLRAPPSTGSVIPAAALISASLA